MNCIVSQAFEGEDQPMRIDLQEPGLWRADGSPYEQFAWLRENDPVHWHQERGEGPGYWALTRHADIKALETDSDTWSSAGSTLIDDYEPVGRDGYRLLINSDPPAHTVRRRFVGQELTPIAVKSQAAHVEDVVTDVLDEVIERGECDFVPDISGRLASFVIADLLGIPRKDALELFFAAEILVRGFSVRESPGLEAAQTVARFGAELWAERSRNHTPDVLGRLAHGEGRREAHGRGAVHPRLLPPDHRGKRHVPQRRVDRDDGAVRAPRPAPKAHR
ncbi:hypothetical protein ACWEP4_35105 [Streptomyces sp. NPDC004227]